MNDYEGAYYVAYIVLCTMVFIILLYIVRCAQGRIKVGDVFTCALVGFFPIVNVIIAVMAWNDLKRNARGFRLYEQWPR